MTFEEIMDRLWADSVNGMWGVYGVPSQPPPPMKVEIAVEDRRCAKCKNCSMRIVVRPGESAKTVLCRLCGHEDRT